MTIQQQSILKRLGEFGWELVAREDVTNWWIDDVWRLRSVWTPRDFQAYLVFIVDPQAEIYVRKPAEQVWAVAATPSVPEESRFLEAESVFSLSPGWESRLPDLFKILTEIRSDAAVEYLGPVAP